MSADTLKRLAADILKVGRTRIRIKEGEYTRAMEALTREDVRGLIDDGAVYSLRFVGHRTKPMRKKQRRGKRRGTKFSRKGEKEAWMERIRAQREYIKALIKSGEMPPEHKRKVYLKVKGGSFKGKKALLIYLKENGFYSSKDVGAGAVEAKPENKAPQKKTAVKKAKAKK